MAIILVTYDLCAPGRDYTPVYNYLKTFTYCKNMESVWLLDTQRSPVSIRDDLNRVIDSNDKLFVTRITREWASWNYNCAAWLNKDERQF